MIVGNNNITFVDTTQGTIYSGSSRIINPSKILGQIISSDGGLAINFGSPSGSSGGNERIYIRDNSTLYITSSGIGINTETPLTNLDIRAITSSNPANLILRTNEDGVIVEGEETGRIIFAIESSSYNFGSGFSFVSSGSTAAIFSRVINAHPTDGAYGSLVFEVNDSTDRTAPIEAMTIGYGLGAANTDIGFIISGAIKTTATANFLSMKSSTSNNELAYLGYSGTSPTPEYPK